MLKNIFKSFVSFIIVLHCIGVSQIMSSYSRDKSVFTGMLSMNEEETKKEKESKEDVDSSKDFRSKFSTQVNNNAFIGKRICLSFSKNRIKHQFHAECVSPPPDLA